MHLFKRIGIKLLYAIECVGFASNYKARVPIYFYYLRIYVYIYTHTHGGLT